MSVIDLRTRQPVDERPGVILLRNSTPGQKDNARSVKAEEVARALLMSLGITVGAVLDEQGTSGKDLSRRPVARQLVDELEAGKWAALAVIEVSRTSRDPDGVDQRIFKRACRRGRALLVTPTKCYDFRNDSDDLQYEMESVLSAREWRVLRKRTWEGNVERARLLPVFYGFAPFGYRKVPATYTIRGTTRNALVLEKDPEQAGLMQAIGAAMDVEDGINAVAWRLNAQGWCQPNGSPWYFSQIQQVIRRSYYRGLWTQGEYREANDLYEMEGVEQITHERPELAWYTEERVAKWQRKFTGKGPIRVRLQGREHPALGVLVCSLCRGLMNGQGERGYSCSHRREGRCKGQNLSDSQANAAIRRLLADVLPGLADLTREVREALTSDARPDDAAELRELDRQIEARFEVATEAKANGVEPPSGFYAKTHDLQERRARLAERMADVDRIESERRRHMARLAEFSDPEQALQLYDEVMTTGEQQQFLGYLFKWVVVETNGGRGNRARAWVSDYEATFPTDVMSVSGLGPWTLWLSRFDVA